MDNRLFKLFENHEQPFDGVALVQDDLLEINDLVECLSVVVDFLEAKYSNEQLYFNEDWHNHDGFIINSKRVNWSYLREITQSREAVFKSRFTDDFVFLLFYPESCSFLLRFDVMEEDDDEQYPGIWGEFEFLASETIVNELEKTLPKSFKFKKENSFSYMSECYAG